MRSVPFDRTLQERIEQIGIIAVLVIDRAEDGPALARALLEGGVGAMELTLRTPAALEALEAIRREVPEMIAGIGTILFEDQVNAAVEAGAAFGVSPGTNPRVLACAASAGLSFAPGICTPSDIEAALSYGCRLLKYFPAETSGGLAHLKNIAAPYNHLGVKFIPLGGLKPDNAKSYLQSPLVGAIGGSWIAPREAIAAQDWESIRANASEATALLRELRS